MPYGWTSQKAATAKKLFEQNGIHSALWIWRSFRKDKWGFELVHEDDMRRETVDVKLMNTLDGVWREANALRLLPMPSGQGLPVAPWEALPPPKM